MSGLWKKMDSTFGVAPIHLLVTQCEIWYAREYDRNDRVEGTAKSLILNFKKDITIKGSNPNAWFYRNRDLRQFGDELLRLFKDRSYHIMAVPGSKPWGSNENNQRFQDLFDYMYKKQNNLIVHWPIDAIDSVPSSSRDTAPRDPELIKSNYKWCGFLQAIPEKIIIIDDVVTSGAHFRATVEFLKSKGFNGEIKGVFWAWTK